MIKLDKSLVPDWDEDNIYHIAEHGLSPEQVEEVYYSEGPFPTLATITINLLNMRPKSSVADKARIGYVAKIVVCICVAPRRWASSC